MNIPGSAKKTKTYKKLNLEQKSTLPLKVKNARLMWKGKNIQFVWKHMSSILRTCGYYNISCKALIWFGCVSLPFALSDSPGIHLP